jgi:hypothetical protein
MSDAYPPIDYEEVGKWPISRFHEGEWYWVRDFVGTRGDAYKLAGSLQEENKDGEYRLWDNRLEES